MNFLVMGGTSGIGLDLVKKLSKDNHVFVLGRNSEKLEAIESKNIHFLKHQVTSFEHLDTFFKKNLYKKVSFDVSFAGNLKCFMGDDANFYLHLMLLYDYKYYLHMNRLIYPKKLCYLVHPLYVYILENLRNCLVVYLLIYQLAQDTWHNLTIFLFSFYFSLNYTAGLG